MGTAYRRPNRSRPRVETTLDPVVLADLRGRAAVAVESQYQTIGGQITRCWRAASGCDYRTAGEIAAIAGVLRGLLDGVAERVSLPENLDALRRAGAAIERLERLERGLRAGRGR